MNRLFSRRKHLILTLLILISLTIFYRIPIKWCCDDPKRHDTEDYLINTPGCYIPLYSKNFSYKYTAKRYGSCGERAIFVQKIENNNVQFQIDRLKMNKYSKTAEYACCYKFASRSTVPKHEDTHLIYTDCKPFDNGTVANLVQEVIRVTCITYKYKTIIYEDAYIILRTFEVINTENDKFWNVLLIGLDTMSRARVNDTMPLITKYLHTQNWLDYRGYHKVEYNTFPNLVSVLSGKKMSTIYKHCKEGFSECADNFIWRKFKEAGFVTAYGEDFLSLPDTFSRYQGFKTPPTDHYMRPLFLTGERRHGSLVCTKKSPSTTHMLDYALSFAEAYKNDKFFGIFWINSYCHNIVDSPSLLDAEIVDFFEKLRKNGVFNNTFIVFFSDHGTRFGEMRLPVESYYDERLPMLFMWVPDAFRMENVVDYYNLQLNQRRLVTPYDLYLTLNEILQFTNVSTLETHSEACPRCTSLFTEATLFRTCADAGVSEKWCSCHNMSATSLIDTNANHSLHLAVSHIQNFTKHVETRPCMVCITMDLSRVLRSHTYRDKHNNTNYVVAFKMSPQDIIFEVIVVNVGDKFSVISTYSLTSYNTRGNCVINTNDRPYCVCQRIKNCTRKRT